MATFKAYPSNMPKGPSRTGWFGPPKNNFPYNASAPNGGGNCTWYAYGRFCEAAGEVIPIAKSGNAWTFYDADKFTKKSGVTRGKKPQIGSIICWSGGYGGAGHVAFVEEVNPKTGDIRVTQSGWTAGWLGSKWLKKKDNYTDWNQLHLRGFIYNPVKFDNVVTLDSKLSWGSEAVDEAATAASPEALKITASQLYSSDNYEFVVQKAVEDTSLGKKLSDFLLEKAKHAVDTTIDDSILGGKIQKTIEEIVVSATSTFGTKLVELANRRITNSLFDISRYLVEAPFVKINFAGIEIGSYRGTLDDYPNYIDRISINKTNGEINNYSIHLVHQIRVGEDPNQLDKLFARNQFNKIKISYGDTSSIQMFTDVEAVITSVSQQRDYSSSRITYTIEATSACSFITAHVMNFPAVVDKPSNVIRKLLYSSEISAELKQAFPMMASQTYVDSKGLIPTNDGVISIVAKQNMDPISYINYLVSCMSNAQDTKKVIRGSTYFIFYKDDGSGAGFEIREIKTNSEYASGLDLNSIYEVNIGYPDNNNIFTFSVSNDKAWSILYDKNISTTTASEYVYTIQDNGDIAKYYSPSLLSSSNTLNEYEKNWWTFMTGFPVTATLTMRGLLRPAFLTNYIRINVVFYGQKHITSGLYAITEQKDELSGSGFRTTFSLVRVSN